MFAFRFHLPVAATLVVLASVILLVPGFAGATLVQRFDVEELARRADLVVIARVVGVHSAWDTSGGGARIRTYAGLEVERALHGLAPAGTRVEVSELGGEVDGIRSEFPGGARFDEGEQVVAFLARRFPGDPSNREMQVVGAFQGRFRLEREAETGMPLAVRQADRGAALVGPLPTHFDEEALAGARRLYLDELEARVRAALAVRVLPAATGGAR